MASGGLFSDPQYFCTSFISLSLSVSISSYLNPPVLRLIRSDEDLVDVPTVSILIRKRRRGGLHQIRIRHQVTGVRGHVFIDLREKERGRKERREGEEGR